MSDSHQAVLSDDVTPVQAVALLNEPARALPTSPCGFVPFLDRKAQREIIMAALRAGPKTTDQLRALGCFQAPTRIFELRGQGHLIETELVTAWAADGRPHPRMALYTLTEGPAGGVE